MISRCKKKPQYDTEKVRGKSGVRVALRLSSTCMSANLFVNEVAPATRIRRSGRSTPSTQRAPSEYPPPAPRVPARGILDRLPRVAQTPPPPRLWQCSRCHPMRAIEMISAAVPTVKTSRILPADYAAKSSDKVSASAAVRMRMCTGSHGSTVARG